MSGGPPGSPDPATSTPTPGSTAADWMSDAELAAPDNFAAS